MGAFVLTRTGFSPERKAKIASNLVLAGLEPAMELELPFGTLALFHPLQGAANVCTAENGDFAFCVGSLIYKKKSGVPALRLLLEDFEPDSFAWDDMMGIYVFGIVRNGTVHIANDALGAFKIYRTGAGDILTSSFMAAMCAVENPSPDPDGCYQFAWNGAAFGERTFAAEVKTAPFSTIVRVDDRVTDLARPCPYFVAARRGSEPADAIVSDLTGILRENFRTYIDVFGDAVNTSLSGGYDSRLILALLLDAGVTPAVFTYGKPTDPDIRVAREVCDAMGLKLEISHNRLSAPPDFTDGYAKAVARNFLITDNGGYNGSFGQGVGIANRVLRAKDAMVFNGSLGEIFRLFYYLPNRSIGKRDFVYGFHYRLDPAACTDRFSPDAYCRSLESALGKAIDQDRDVLDRQHVELAYPLFRGRYWTSQDAAINQRFGPTIYPFMERNIVTATYGIPIAHKSAGKLEARMIAHLNPKLASITSDYGHAFDSKPTLKYRLVYNSSKYRPTILRKFSYRFRHSFRRAFPDYLTERHLERVMDVSFPYMSPYFNVDRIYDSVAFNRVATMEYIFQHWR